MITNRALAKQSKSKNQQEPINMQRRILMGGALAAALASSGRALGEENHREPDNPFIVLLKGLYQPVPAGDGPTNNLGLPKALVDLSDGSYSKTRIYPILGIPERNDQDRPIGTFYFGGPNANLCAYDLPGGAIAMKFNDPPVGVPPELGFNNFSTLPFPDGQGGS